MLYQITIQRVDGSVEVFYTPSPNLANSVLLHSGDRVRIEGVPAVPAPTIEPVTRFDRNEVV